MKDEAGGVMFDITIFDVFIYVMICLFTIFGVKYLDLIQRKKVLDQIPTPGPDTEIFQKLKKAIENVLPYTEVIETTIERNHVEGPDAKILTFKLGANMERGSVRFRFGLF